MHNQIIKGGESVGILLVGLPGDTFGNGHQEIAEKMCTGKTQGILLSDAIITERNFEKHFQTLLRPRGNWQNNRSLSANESHSTVYQYKQQNEVYRHLQLLDHRKSL